MATSVRVYIYVWKRVRTKWKRFPLAFQRGDARPDFHAWRSARDFRFSIRGRFAETRETTLLATIRTRKAADRFSARTALEIVPRISVIFVEEDRPLQLCLIFDGWALRWRKNFLLLIYFSSVLSKSSSEFGSFVGFDEVISKIKEKCMLIFRVYSFGWKIHREIKFITKAKREILK